MKSLPTNGMPFDVYEQIQAQKYGHPATYPNSENIAPPLEKKRLRVIEAATRTDLKLDQTRQIEDRMKEIQTLREQAKTRYSAYDNGVPSTYTEGEYVDIEV
tara:strand:+ start:2178 stop:2483 length:306 start_codon:yes stop_codon:yes gene_type:complete